MLVYIIDAFNLAHKIPELKKSPSVKTDLLNYIKKKNLTGSVNNKVIIVFDGYPELNLSYGDDYKVFFSCDKKADDVIKAKIDGIKNRPQVRVVSDDREIKDYAKKSGAVALGNSEFLKTKNKAQHKNSGSSKDISYADAKEITDELREIWLKE